MTDSGQFRRIADSGQRSVYKTEKLDKLSGIISAGQGFTQATLARGGTVGRIGQIQPKLHCPVLSSPVLAQSSPVQSTSTQSGRVAQMALIWQAVQAAGRVGASTRP